MFFKLRHQSSRKNEAERMDSKRGISFVYMKKRVISLPWTAPAPLVDVKERDAVFER